MMLRILFGALLGLLAAYPVLIAIVFGVIAAAICQPVVLMAAVGYALYPLFARAVRGWFA
ncbi:hypothetical protein [Streptomyces sp. NPDC055210]